MEVESLVRVGERDSYQIIEQINKGGFSDIYRARQWRASSDTPPEDVAIKVLRKLEPENIRRFNREINILKGIHLLAKDNEKFKEAQDHIVKVIDAGEFYEKGEKHPCIVMEYIKGSKLSEIASSLPQPQIIRYIIQVAKGVEVLHKVGLIHRDIKPQNIIITSTEPTGGATPRAVLVDFGTAKFPTSHDITTEGWIGTPMFLAPEQARCEELDKTVDIYQLGMTLYTSLTSSRPVEISTHGSSTEIVLKIAQGKVRPQIEKKNPKIPQPLYAVIQKATRYNPKDRYQDVSEFIRDLELYLDGKTPLACKERIERRVISLTRVALLISAISAIFFVSKWFLNRENSAGALTYKPSVESSQHPFIKEAPDDATHTNASVESSQHPTHIEESPPSDTTTSQSSALLPVSVENSQHPEQITTQASDTPEPAMIPRETIIIKEKKIVNVPAPAETNTLEKKRHILGTIKDADELVSKFKEKQDTSYLENALRLYDLALDEGRDVLLPEDITRIYKKKGVTLFYLKEYQKAVDNFISYIKEKTDDAQVYYFMGHAFIQLGKNQQGLQYLIKAKELDPRYDMKFEKPPKLEFDKIKK